MYETSKKRNEGKVDFFLFESNMGLYVCLMQSKGAAHEWEQPLAAHCSQPAAVSTMLAFSLKEAIFFFFYSSQAWGYTSA